MLDGSLQMTYTLLMALEIGYKVQNYSHMALAILRGLHWKQQGCSAAPVGASTLLPGLSMSLILLLSTAACQCYYVLHHHFCNVIVAHALQTSDSFFR